MHFKINWVLLKISQISLEKYMCWSLFLRKLQALRPANLLKRNPNTGIFLWNWQDFQKHFFLQNTSGGWFLKKNNSNILFKDFSGIPLTHNKSLNTCNSQVTNFKLENAFTYQKLVPIKRFCNRFRTISKGSDLNINNF